MVSLVANIIVLKLTFIILYLCYFSRKKLGRVVGSVFFDWYILNQAGTQAPVLAFTQFFVDRC